jgi:hypothetical protein
VRPKRIQGLQKINDDWSLFLPVSDKQESANPKISGNPSKFGVFGFQKASKVKPVKK